MLLVWLPQFQLGDVDVSRQRSAEKKPASVTAETRPVPVPVGRRRARLQQSAEKKPTSVTDETRPVSVGRRRCQSTAK